jgi:GAF domain-containing protein
MGSEATPDRLRLAAVRALVGSRRISATALDHIAQVARDRFKVPTALVTLVDGEVLYFAGRAGSDVEQTMTQGSLCAETIRGDDVFVIEDAAADERFAVSAVVAGPPYIRFYAGAPIVLDSGEHVGSMCVMDVTPRRFNVGERVVLKHMALAAKTELERVCTAQALAAARPN